MDHPAFQERLEYVAEHKQAKLNAELRDKRTKELEGLGAVISSRGNIGVDADANWPLATLYTHSEDDFEAIRQAVIGAVERKDKAAYEKREKEVREAQTYGERTAILKALGATESLKDRWGLLNVVAMRNNILDDVQWEQDLPKFQAAAEEVARMEEHKKQQAAEAERKAAEEQRAAIEAAKDDSQRWKEYREALLSVPSPTLKTAEAQHAHKTLREYISNYGKNI